MTSAAIILILLAFAVFCTYKMSQYKPKVITPMPEKPKLTEKPVEKEKPIELVISDIKEKRKQEEAQEQAEWLKKFYGAIPEHEHPNYIEVSPDDEIDEETNLIAMSGPIRTQQHRINKDGVKYGYIKDYSKNEARIRYKDFTKKVDW